MKWISIKKIPNARLYNNGFCFPAVSSFYGFGVLVRTTSLNGIPEWLFTNNYKDYQNLDYITHYMDIPHRIYI